MFYYITIGAITLGIFLHFLLTKLWPIRSHDAKAQILLRKNDPELFKLMQVESGKINYPMETLIYVHYAMLSHLEDEEVNAEDICRNFLDLVKDIYSKSAKEGMNFLKISNSDQVGQIAFELIKSQIVPPVGALKQEDFKDLFEA